MRSLIITAHHDYRTPRRSSVHFIADELARRGPLGFFSLRYSALSRYKSDIRGVVDKRANRVELYEGVKCFLWKTLIHPFNTRRRWLRPAENALFWLYQHMPSATLVQWIRSADVIIYESGIAPIFFELAKRLSPGARHIYLASDDLATIDVADYAMREFSSVAPRMDALCLVARSMADNIASRGNVFFVPHGLDPGLMELGDPSPYGPGLHAVSVGSMLFDSHFFEIASHAFPQVNFHVIGSGHAATPAYGANVRVYGDMKYNETIRYIKHASFGIAPYLAEQVPAYLADSSMKMLQYDFFGLPSVCPWRVTGAYATRFGYQPGDADSIIRAVRAALAAPHERSRPILSWSQVTDRLLDPARYGDARI